MKAIVNGVVAIDRAEIELDRITMLVGPNEAGKSTIADCIAATLTGVPNMRGLAHKKDLAYVVRDGYEEGFCELVHENGTNRMTWPGGEMKTKGEPLQSSPIATGRVRFTMMKEADRTSYLTKLLKALPTYKQTEDALKDAGVVEAAIKDTIVHLRADGFAKTEQWAKDEGVIGKRDFERATGERWGSQKGEGWAPEGYDPEQAIDDDTYMEAKEAINAARLASAVDAAERERLLAIVATISDLEESVQDIEENRIPEAEKTILEKTEALNAIPKLEDNPLVFRCPYGEMALCADKRIEVQMGPRGPVGLKENFQKKRTDEEIKKIRMDIATVGGQLSHAKDARNALQRELSQQTLRLEEARKAAATLEAADKVPDEGNDDGAPGPEEIVRLFEAQQTVANVRDIHRRIMTLTEIQKVVGADGIRRRVLRSALEKFNKEVLAPLSAMASETPIEIGMDLMVYSGRIPYGMLSAGRRALVDMVIQCALAQVDGSPVIICDDVDTIEKKHRPKVLQMLAKTGKVVVLCLHVSYPQDTIDLAKFKIGRTWWVADGKVVPFSEVMEKAA